MLYLWITTLLLTLFCSAGCEPQSTAASNRSSPTPRSIDSAPSPTQTVAQPSDTETAIDVIRQYYNAINQRNYQQAYQYWGDNGAASGQSFDAFKQGYAQTASVQIEIGQPGQVKGAAGSRYVDIPIAIASVTTSGETQRFRGKYVMRRTAVKSAPEAQQKWHLYSSDISPVKS